LKRIGILGFGNMGSALAAGLERAGGFTLAVNDIRAERAAEAREKFGLTVIDDKKELFAASDIVVLAVKPQEWKGLSPLVAGMGRGRAVITLMAGVSMGGIREDLQADAVARFMPNLAARESKALVGVAFGEPAPEAFRTATLDIARAIGTPLEVSEYLMAAITGISGSGIAFVFAFLHAMALGGVSVGLAYPQALTAALATVEGAVEVVRRSGENPVEWLTRVISPAGTTIRGIEALEAGGFTHAVMAAVTQATARAAALESKD
jgi:pyrroline-5-carboxylate reductase